MKFLVDANVLSEATKAQPLLAVVDWLQAHEPDVVLSPIILGEIEYGILQLPAGRKRTRLLQWLMSGIRHLPVLEIDARTGRIWAKLLADLRRKGRAMQITDSLIAATAIQHRLTLATRDVDDFRHCGVRLVNPFTIR
jgi:predicted nucleic acid-binding protein